MTPDRDFVPLSLDKHDWSPSPLPGQIVIVATIDADGAPNIAPKSWISMAAFRGPIVGFGCNHDHRTCRNILDTGQFVINTADREIAAGAWDMLSWHGAERIEHSGLTLIPSSVVQAPRIAECAAHIECRLHQVVEFDGGEVFIFGKVLAVDIARVCTGGTVADRYRALDPVFFLESETFSSLAGEFTTPPHR